MPPVTSGCQQHGVVLPVRSNRDPLLPIKTVPKHMVRHQDKKLTCVTMPPLTALAAPERASAACGRTQVLTDFR